MYAIIALALFAGYVSAGGVTGNLVTGQKSITDEVTLPKKSVVSQTAFNTNSALNLNRGAAIIGTGGQQLVKDTFAKKWTYERAPTRTVTTTNVISEKGHLSGQTWKSTPLHTVTSNVISRQGSLTGGQKLVKDNLFNRQWNSNKAPLHKSELHVKTKKNTFGAPFSGQKVTGQLSGSGAYDQSQWQNEQSWENRKYSGDGYQSWSRSEEVRVPRIAYTYVKPAFVSTGYAYYSGHGLGTGTLLGSDGKRLRNRVLAAAAPPAVSQSSFASNDDDDDDN